MTVPSEQSVQLDPFTVDVDHLRDVILEGLQSMPEVLSAQTPLLLDEPDVVQP